MKAPFNCYAIYTQSHPKTDDPDEPEKFELTAVIRAGSTYTGHDGYAMKELIKVAFQEVAQKSIKVYIFNEGETVWPKIS